MFIYICARARACVCVYIHYILRHHLDQSMPNSGCWMFLLCMGSVNNQENIVNKYFAMLSTKTWLIIIHICDICDYDYDNIF